MPEDRLEPIVYIVKFKYLSSLMPYCFQKIILKSYRTLWKEYWVMLNLQF